MLAKNLFLKSIYLSVFLLSITACKKDHEVCTSYTELNDRQHLCDLTPLNKVPKFLDTLTKYPQLRVSSIVDDEYMIKMDCDKFSGNLIIFFDTYELVISKSDNYFYSGGDIKVPQNIDNIPLISSEDAIVKAKSEIRFPSCVNYRLGLFPKYNEIADITTDTLAWKITDSKGNTPFVIIDAKTGLLLMKDDGIRYAQ